MDDFASKNLVFEVKLLNLVEKDNFSLQKVISENCDIIKPSVSANPPENVSSFFYDKQFLLDIGVAEAATLNIRQLQ